MKRTITKLFMLSAALLLSAASFAQDEIQHRYPEVKFTYNGKEYTVPAWDVWYKNPANGYVNGHLRVQRKAQNADGSYTGKYVTRYAIYDDSQESNRLWVPAKTTQVTVGTVTKAIGDLKYSNILTADQMIDGVNYEANVIDFSTLAISGDFTMTDFVASDGDTYKIDEIGDYAFRQPYRGNHDSHWFSPTTVTIPAAIKKIGRGSFFMTPIKEVIMEEGSLTESTTIPEFNFQDCTLLETITFPSSITKLEGTVLGGCPALKKVIFKSETAPTLDTFSWLGVSYGVFETSSAAGATVPEKCVIEVPLHSAKKYVDANEKFKEFPMSSKFKMNKEYVSYCSDLPFTFKQYDAENSAWNNGDVKVYYVQDSDVKLSEGKIDLTEITATKIPSETVEGITPLDSYNSETGFETGYFGVILSGTAGETYDISYPNNIACDELTASKNLLQGIIKDALIEVNEDFLFFVLSGGKFLTVENPGTLSAHKVYLFYDGDQTMPFGARELSISMPEVTGIKNHEMKSAKDDVIYNMQGIQVKQPQKGIFIKNGKKYVIK